VKARFLVAGAALLAAALFAQVAAAHAVGLSHGEYRATADGLHVVITIARPEAIDLVGDTFAKQIRVARAGSPCPGTLTAAAPTESDGLSLTLDYRCAGARSAPTSVDVDLLQALSFGHRHAARVVSGSVERDLLLMRSMASFEIPALLEARDEGAPAAGAAAQGFLRMGFEHILAGIDHLIFLFGVVLVGRRLRAMALAVTAFTLGHSLSLALAVLHLASPPSALIEPAIALSIAYVGVENLWLRSSDQRWRITFPFGLVHGFGFAGALAAVDIPAPRVPLALFSFNAGVELGQLLMLVAFLPPIFWLRRHQAVARRAVPALSALVVAAGIAFFLDRTWTAIRSATPVVLASGAK